MQIHQFTGPTLKRRSEIESRSLRADRPGLTARDQYLAQFLHSSARYLPAEGDCQSGDLDWAGYAFETRTTRGFR